MRDRKPWPADDMILFGGDYNPEQWLDRPDILQEDLRLMQEAGVTAVSLGMFSWSSLEPEEGVFTFEWMERVIDGLHRCGIFVFLATPSGARPRWMARKYPEVLRVQPDGTRNLFGGRHNHCFSSPVYREKTGIINRELAKRFGGHPGVILWHISNEYSGECHCSLCRENFRSWLKQRFGSLEELNKAWWTSFWSHTVTDWSHIDPPAPHGEQSLHGLALDWKRFVTHMTVDFMHHEVSALREAGSFLPVTTNMMPGCNELYRDPGLDYWKFQDLLDIASWDSYPAWHLPGYRSPYLEDSDAPPDDYRRASEEAFHHDLFRCLGKGRFLLMESTPSIVNWQLRSKIKKPGMIVLAGLHAVSHGSSSVQFFQWRKSRGSSEKFHGAFLGHDAAEADAGLGRSRVFRECCDLGRILGDIKEVSSAAYAAETALLYSWENRWAFENAKDAVNGPAKGFFETLKRHYFALWAQGISMDILSGDEDVSVFAGKKLIIAPMLYLLPDALARKLEEFVQQGGTLVCTYMSGHVGESDLCIPGGAPGGLSKVLGLRTEETDALYPGEDVKMTLESSGSCFAVHDYQDVIHLEGAEVIAQFQGGLADKGPALTMHRFGKGCAWYLGGRLDASALSELYRRIRTEAGVHSSQDLLVRRDKTIDVQVRSTDETRYLFVMNPSDRPGTVEFMHPCSQLYSGDDNLGIERSLWEIPAYGAKVLAQKIQ